MTPFEAYKLFIALKNHFTSSYDYFKYNGSVKADAASFDNRKDKYYFYKLSKMKDPRGFIVSNLVSDNGKWIGDLFTDKADRLYTEWLKRQQSLSYNFQNECSKLLTNFNDNFIVKNGQHPHLLKMYRQGEVSLETMVILEDILGFSSHWNKSIDDTIIWPKINKLMSKYRMFCNYDKFKLRKQLRQLVDHD